MKAGKIYPTKKFVKSFDIKPVGKSLTNRQKEIIKLLQNKETLIINNKEVFITSGNLAKKITPHTFYSLINKGLVLHRTEWPFNYVLSETGGIIKI